MAKTRERWASRVEFLLVAVGFSVGVGDLWRFPYLVMKNGGGAFIIPIVIFNVVGAIPMVYLEMIMGQYASSGALSIWKVCPLFKGVGYGTIIATFIFSIYYAVIICWMLFYFINSFFPTLPWSSCDNDWNTNYCEVYDPNSLNIPTNSNQYSNMTTQFINATMSTIQQTTLTMANMMTTQRSIKASPVEEFWNHNALKISSGLEDLGDVNWPLLGCLLAIEVLCFLCIFKGVKVTGKVVYFTVALPFVLLTVFLIRSAILPGAREGVLFYLTPDLEKLKDPKIWAEACMQVFVSIGPGFGGMITFASYNKFNNNCLRDAIIVCLSDLMTGIYGGFVIFTTLGHLSYRTGVPIDKFKTSGYGLGFITYPEAANFLPLSQLWCVLFFFMTIFLGLDSQFPNYEIVVTALCDEFPKIFKGKKMIMTVGVILCAFLLAIPMVTQGGIYLLTLIDWYAATFSVTVFAVLECLVWTYIYGMKNLDTIMISMMGKKVPVVFKMCWYLVTPLLLVRFRLLLRPSESWGPHSEAEDHCINGKTGGELSEKLQYESGQDNPLFAGLVTKL
ncbi:hypothetical protein CHS0354_003538 [Potamilus streckersoni]|uniref:Transporter n=1 Tax=Potamilus streckersoni TaxID=2493646 RepID=A0AAE0VJL9_9BIVA|nr:hypothetical protein CHS0354_003538 [Potamilus streckersoni]